MSEQKECLDGHGSGHRNDLRKKLKQDIDDSALTYGDVIWVLNYLVAEYQDKASNLLNGTKIQKVVDSPRH